MTAGIDQYGYSLRFSRRARRVSISVAPHGVSVTAPPGVDRGIIDTFVESRSGWIKEKLALFNSCSGPSSIVQLKDGASFWLLGREVYLQVTDVKGSPVLQNDVLLMEKGLSESRFSKWLDEQLISRVVSFSNYHSKIAGLNPTRIRIGNARTRWGSCSGRGVIMMNRKLVHAPLDVIEYVLVHELVHLRHRNHSHLFWSMVEQSLGDVKPQKKWLRLQGAFLI